MKKNTENLLPKILHGTVHEQYVRCGKENCKCSRGELHGAYYYHFVRIDGRLRKLYLKASQVEEVRAACLARQQEEREQRTVTDAVWRKLRKLQMQLREIQQGYGKYQCNK